VGLRGLELLRAPAPASESPWRPEPAARRRRRIHPWADLKLRYGAFPRVLTPDEIVELVSDNERFGAMARAADITSNS